MLENRLHHWKSRFGLGVPPSTGAKEALQWLMLVRLVVLYTVLVVMMLQQVFRQGSVFSYGPAAGYLLLSIAFGFNLFHASLIDRLPVGWVSAVMSIIFDAAVTSAWIFFAVGRENVFGLLYLIQILSVALIFYQRGALTAALASMLSFGVVVWMRNETYASPWLVWGLYSTIFWMVGLVGGYLSEELLRTTEKLRVKSDRIEKLTALHERIISNLPTGLLTVDSTMTVNFVNPAGEQILGKRSENITGKNLLEVLPDLSPFFSQIEEEEVKDNVQDPGYEEKLAATGDEIHRSYFLRGRSDRGSARLQQRVEIGKGTQRKILRGDVAELDTSGGMGRLLNSGTSGGRVLLFQDVTALLHLEEKLKQNEKLAAVGQLAAGIAHEIRNPLASMSASIELLKGNIPGGLSQENQKLMDIAIREIDRLNRLITEFLDFVKPARLKLVSVDIGAVMGEVATQIRGLKEFRASLTLEEKFTTGTLAFADAEKLKQVIWNLMVNAVQASPQGGKISVGCNHMNDKTVTLWVEDSGEGMSEEVISHLYEPFFTTKDKGTGLGLATAYKIVEGHHGEIRVNSKLKAGTRFEVLLPRA